MFQFSNEKHFLAMLAVPVLLSMTLGFSGDFYKEDSITDRDTEEIGQEELKGEKVSKVMSQGRDTQIKNNILDSTKGYTISKQGETQLAIESNNFEDFILAVKETPFADIMTKEAFGVLVHEYHVQKGYHPSEYIHLV